MFGKKVKLSPRYIGPHLISKRVGYVAYELELPQDLEVVYPVIHVSMLNECFGDPFLILPTKNFWIKYRSSYEDILIQILDRQV